MIMDWSRRSPTSNPLFKKPEWDKGREDKWCQFFFVRR